jgi:hypothetical protein
VSDDEARADAVNAVAIGMQLSSQLLHGLRGAMPEGTAIVTHALALAWAAHVGVEALRKLLTPEGLALFESALADVRQHADLHSAIRSAQHEQAEAGKAVPLG